MKVVIIDSGGANISSIIFALKKLNVEPIFTKDIKTINTADKIILPGVGTAQYAMEYLNKNNLINTIKNLKQPTLGICLGMQILFNKSEEGNTKCLEIINNEVKKFEKKQNFPIPHMGWNIVKKNKDSPLLKNIDDNYFYFVHSYYAPIGEYTISTCLYSSNISAIVQKDNFYGCQFHPEKSGENGMKILKNFLEL